MHRNLFGVYFFFSIHYCYIGGVLNYDVNPPIILSGPRGVVSSNDWQISHGLLLYFNR